MDKWVETQSIKYGNCTITVHRPVLTPSEKAKRERQVQDVVGRVMREYVHRKEEQHGKYERNNHTRA